MNKAELVSRKDSFNLGSLLTHGKSLIDQNENVRSLRRRIELSPQDVWTYIEHTQDFLSKVKIDQDHIDIQIGKEPIRIEFMSDIHMGSSIMDIASIRARVDRIIKTPGMYVILGGDVIDGVNKEYLDTMGEQAALANVNSQIEAFKVAIYYPLLEAKKVLGAISGFGGHEEWIRKATGLNPSRALYDDAIPYLENGGEAWLFSPGNKPADENPDLKLYLAHDDGAGNNPIDPFKGQRSAVEVHPEVSGSASGHNHGVSAESKTVRNGRTITYLKEGTEKGNNSNRRDRLPTRDHPNTRTVRGGTGFIIYDRDHGVQNQDGGSTDGDEIHQNEPLVQNKLVNYNILGAQDNYSPELASKTYSDTTYQGIQLWDYAKRTGDVESILGAFREKAKGYDVGLVKSRSVGKKFDGDPTDHWDKLSYKVRPLDPNTIGAIKLDNFSSARWPSIRAQKDEIKKRSIEIANDPFAFALVLREMFDKDAADSPRKEKDFERLMKLMESVLGSGKVLAWLQSGSMRNKKWGEFLPAAIINERYDVPIVNNYASLLLNMHNGPELAVMLLDATRFNSNTNIFHGPYKAMQKYPGHDLLIGGKSIESGYESYRDGSNQTIKKILIPGWLNHEVNIGEKGARESAPINHAAVVINMLTGEIEIGVSEWELNDLYEAVQLWMACSQSTEGLDYYLDALKPNK